MKETLYRLCRQFPDGSWIEKENEVFKTPEQLFRYIQYTFGEIPILCTFANYIVPDECRVYYQCTQEEYQEYVRSQLEQQ